MRAVCRNSSPAMYWASALSQAEASRCWVVQGTSSMAEGSGSNKGYKGSVGRPPATEIRVPGGVTAAAVSPDGACIATAGVDGVMRIYSISGGPPTAGFKVRILLKCGAASY